MSKKKWTVEDAVNSVKHRHPYPARLGWGYREARLKGGAFHEAERRGLIERVDGRKGAYWYRLVEPKDQSASSTSCRTSSSPIPG